MLSHLRYILTEDPKIEISGTHLIWTGKTTPNGHPKTSANNDARAFVWEREHVDGHLIMDDMEILPCDLHNECVNPEHLQVVTKGCYRKPFGEARAVFNPHRRFTALEDTPWDALVVCYSQVYHLGRSADEKTALHKAERWADDHVQELNDRCHKDRNPKTGELRRNRK